MFIKVSHMLFQRLLHKKSIQFQLLFTFTFITIIPVLLVGYFTFHASSSTVSEEVKQSNGQLMDEIERNLYLYFRNLEVEGNVFASKMIDSNISFSGKLNYGDIHFLDNISSINEYLFSEFQSTGVYKSIRVFSNKGVLITSAFDRKSYRTYSYDSKEERDWQNRMQQNRGKKLIFDVHPLEGKQPLSLTASKSVYDPVSGKRIDYISYDIKLSSFSTLFQPFEKRPGSLIQLISNNGKILYDTNQKLINSRVDSSWLQSIISLFHGNETTPIVYDQSNMIIVRKLPQLGCYLVGNIPLSFVYENTRPLGKITFVISLISFILVLTLSFLLSIFISRPIKELSDAMQKVETGLSSVSVPVVGSSLETYRLSMSFGSMLARLNELVKTQYEMELHKKDAELKALMMQINPHFLYNTLEVVSGIADYERVDKISEITQSLSKMLRYNIDLKSDEVRLAEEIENCRNFILILKHRFEDKLQVELDVDPEAKPYKIVKTVLQPLVENAVKHGVEKKLGKAWIKLSVQKQGSRIQIHIMDNGVGFDQQVIENFESYKHSSSTTFYEPTAAKHIGLKNVYNRLNLLFGESLQFSLEGRPQEGSTVFISFPAIFVNDLLQKGDIYE